MAVIVAGTLAVTERLMSSAAQRIYTALCEGGEVSVDSERLAVEGQKIVDYARAQWGDVPCEQRFALALVAVLAAGAGGLESLAQQMELAEMPVAGEA